MAQVRFSAHCLMRFAGHRTQRPFLPKVSQRLGGPPSRVGDQLGEGLGSDPGFPNFSGHLLLLLRRQHPILLRSKSVELYDSS